MQTTANTRTDPLAVHRAVMAAAGPEALAGITRDLTPRERALFGLFFAAIGPGGVDHDDEKLAILVDPARREAYLAEATR